MEREAIRVLVLETKSLLDWDVVDGTHKEKRLGFFSLCTQSLLGFKPLTLDIN